MSEVTAKGAMEKPAVWPVSVKAYHVLGELGLIPENTELLYGQVYEKMPKSPLHCLLIMRLFEPLRLVTLRNAHVRQEQPLVCGDSEPEPGLAIVKGSFEDYGQAHPTTADLVIEICVTTEDYDRSKLRAYAQAAVKEVWLVLLQQKQIEVHQRISGSACSARTVYGPGERVTCISIPEFSVDLDRLFADLRSRH
jgi:Uma2 family endonuclease